MTPFLLFDFNDAEAKKSQGTYNTSYGSNTKNIVCGDRLCSEVVTTSRGSIKQQEAMYFKPSEDIRNTPKEITTINTEDYPKIQRIVSASAKHTAFTSDTSVFSEFVSSLQSSSDATIYAVMNNKLGDCYALKASQETRGRSKNFFMDVIDCYGDTKFRLFADEGILNHGLLSYYSFIQSPRIDSEGNLYFFNTAEKKIIKASSSGIQWKISTWGLDIPANGFRSFDLDSHDNLYVPGPNHGIVIYDKNGVKIDTWKNIPYTNDLTHEMQPYVLQNFFNTGELTIIDSHWNRYVNGFQGYKEQINTSQPSGCNPSDTIRSVTSFDPVGLTREGYGVERAGSGEEYYGSGLNLVEPIVSTRNFYARGENAGNLNYPHTNTEYRTSDNLFNPNPCFIVILVHGYNNSFEMSKGKYGDIYNKLKDLGTPNLAENLILYTWDSDTKDSGGEKRYNEAEHNSWGNGAALATFIKDYKEQHPNTKIFLIAHSMGAELTNRAMNYLDKHYDNEIKIDQIDFLAPSTEANQLNDEYYGLNYFHRLRGPLIVHANGDDDALRTAKNIGAVHNPLGLEGIGLSCTDSTLATSGIFGVAIDNNDRVYAIQPGLGKIYKLDPEGKLLRTFDQFQDKTGKITPFDACSLKYGKVDYVFDQFFLGSFRGFLPFYFDDRPPLNPVINGVPIQNIYQPIRDDSASVNVPYDTPFVTDRKNTRYDVDLQIPLSCIPQSPVLVHDGDAIIINCVGQDIHENQIIVDFLISAGNVQAAHNLGDDIIRKELDDSDVNNLGPSINKFKNPVAKIQKEHTIEPLNDSFINSNTPNYNEGQNHIMLVSSNNRGLISFSTQEISNVIGTDQLTSSQINLFVSNTNLKSRDISIHKMNGANWNEGNGFWIKPSSLSEQELESLRTRGSGNGVTWNCHKDDDITNFASDCAKVAGWSEGGKFVTMPTNTITITAEMNQQWITFDVTADVQDALHNNKSIIGWIIKLDDESKSGKVEIATKEHPILSTNVVAPRMKIEY